MTVRPTGDPPCARVGTLVLAGACLAAVLLVASAPAAALSPPTQRRFDGADVPLGGEHAAQPAGAGAWALEFRFSDMPPPPPGSSMCVTPYALTILASPGVAVSQARVDLGTTNGTAVTVCGPAEVMSQRTGAQVEVRVPEPAFWSLRFTDVEGLWPWDECRCGLYGYSDEQQTVTGRDAAELLRRLHKPAFTTAVAATVRAGELELRFTGALAADAPSPWLLHLQAGAEFVDNRTQRQEPHTTRGEHRQLAADGREPSLAFLLPYQGQEAHARLWAWPTGDLGDGAGPGDPMPDPTGPLANATGPGPVCIDVDVRGVPPTVTQSDCRQGEGPRAYQPPFLVEAPAEPTPRAAPKDVRGAPAFATLAALAFAGAMARRA